MAGWRNHYLGEGSQNSTDGSPICGDIAIRRAQEDNALDDIESRREMTTGFWDPVWEYVLSDHEDDDNSETIQTIETSVVSEKERRTKAARKKQQPVDAPVSSSSKNSQQIFSGEIRDDETSKRYQWRKIQQTNDEREKTDDNTKREDYSISLWDTVSVKEDEKNIVDEPRTEKAPYSRISTKKLFKKKKKLNKKIQPTNSQATKISQTSGQNAKQLTGTQAIKPTQKSNPQTNMSTGGSLENTSSNKRRLNRPSQQKPLNGSSQQKSINKSECQTDPILMIFKAIEEAYQLDPFGIYAFQDPPERYVPIPSRSASTSSSETDDSDISSGIESQMKTTARKDIRSKVEELRLKFRPDRNNNEERKTAEEDFVEDFCKEGYVQEDSDVTKSCFKGKDVLRTSIPPRDDSKTSQRHETQEERGFDDETLHSEQISLGRGHQSINCFSTINRPIPDPIYTENCIRGRLPQGPFPTVRMVSDVDDVQIQIGQQVDHVNGIFGIPSDKFLETKGPKSMYFYNYESKTNMDISYSEFSEDPVSCLGVRNLGQPPSLRQDDNRVIIKVEASTISTTDCFIRRGKWIGHRGIQRFPITPGVDFVGKVFATKQNLASRYDLEPGQTVISLVKFGGNARFLSVHPEKLVKVPSGIDPSQAACLPETYLSAFQALHFGQPGSNRYSEKSLKGKSVLIIGSMTCSYGKALIELATYAGTTIIYATAKKKHWRALIELGIIPLALEPSDWIRRLEGTVDLVLAVGDLREAVTPLHRRTLSDTGHLIMCGRQSPSNDIPVGEWKDRHPSIVCRSKKTSLRLMERTHSYNVYEQWETNLPQCKQDLMHLLSLMEKNVIQPKILERLPLLKVAKAQKLLDSKSSPLSGFLVCEPWLAEKKRALYI